MLTLLALALASLATGNTRMILGGTSVHPDCPSHVIRGAGGSIPATASSAAGCAASRANGAHDPGVSDRRAESLCMPDFVQLGMALIDLTARPDPPCFLSWDEPISERSSARPGTMRPVCQVAGISDREGAGTSVVYKSGGVSRR